MSNDLKPDNAVLTATITITRAGTGKVEHYTLTGTPVAPEPASEKPDEQQPKEN